MTKIAFLGLGAMGSRMAARLIDAGHDVTVWNRTPAAVEPLALRGARIAGTPKAAATGATFVLSMVYDDAASRAVWTDPMTGALHGMSGDALGVEMSTLSPQHVGALHAAAGSLGIAFVDAPLAGSRPQAEAGQLIFMAGGQPDDLARVGPVLLGMGGAVHHAGGPGAGSVVKLMVNTLFGVQLATMAELLGLAAKAGVDPACALEIVGSTPVASPAVKLAGGAMLARSFAPAAPIDLIAKDLGLAVDLGTGLGQGIPMTQAAGDVYRAASAEGYGLDNITGVVQRYIQTDKIAAE
jgi:3-hydroxyisobutyrate dehydrogenase